MGYECSLAFGCLWWIKSCNGSGNTHLVLVDIPVDIRHSKSCTVQWYRPTCYLHVCFSCWFRYMSSPASSTWLLLQSYCTHSLRYPQSRHTGTLGVGQQSIVIAASQCKPRSLCLLFLWSYQVHCNKKMKGESIWHPIAEKMIVHENTYWHDMVVYLSISSAIIM